MRNHDMALASLRLISYHGLCMYEEFISALAFEGRMAAGLCNTTAGRLNLSYRTWQIIAYATCSFLSTFFSVAKP